MTTNTKPVPVGRIMLKNVRLSFPALFEPEAFKPGDTPKFKATLLVEKDSEQAKLVEKKILAVLKEKYPSKAENLLKNIRGNPNKFCWQDGDTKSYDGYEGMMALSAKSTTAPKVLDADRSELSERSGKPYAGCYVNASVELFAYDNSGVGLSASLRGIQFWGHGDSFSGSRPADADEFEAAEAGADAEDFA